METDLTIVTMQVRGKDPLVWVRVPELHSSRIYTMRLRDLTPNPPTNDEERDVFKNTVHRAVVTGTYNRLPGYGLHATVL